MNFSYSVNINSSFNNKKKDASSLRGSKLSPQQEYWLDRILRNHSGQIFFVITLFLLITLSAIIAAVFQENEGQSITETSSGQVIEMKSGNSIIRIQN